MFVAEISSPGETIVTTPAQRVPTPTISERLADYVVDLRYEDIPSSAVDSAKELLAYALGAALRGRTGEHGRRAMRTAIDLSGTDGDYSLIGDRRRTDLLGAIFGNSSLIQWSGFQDWSPPGVNAGVIVHPIALTVGESNHASGRELLTSVVAGYEVIATLLGSVWGWGSDMSQPPMSVLGPFGGAATAARLFKLSRTQTTHAFGHAGQMGMGLFEGAVRRSVVYPLLARNGTIAAALARAGWPGASTIVEGSRGVYRTYLHRDVPDSVHRAVATLGSEFAIRKAEIRRYPASILNHTPIDLAQGLVAQHSLTPNRIAALDLVLPDERKSREAFYGRMPGSTRCLMALIVAGHDVTDPVHNERFPGTDFDAVLDKIRLRFESGRDLRYARVEVTTTEGDKHTAEADSYTPADFDWNDWLGACRGPDLSERQLTRLADLIRRLEDVTDVSDLLACTIPHASA